MAFEANKQDEDNWRKWSTSPELWEKLQPLAREKRSQPTAAKAKLWQLLRGRKFTGHKFRRQHSIERFIVDFFCPEAKLVIEVDGPVHEYSSLEDAVRQEFLESQGLHVVRITNGEIFTAIDAVLERIASALQHTTAPGSPSPNSEPMYSSAGSGGEVNLS